MSELSNFLKKSGVKVNRKRSEPLWRGPSVDHPQGGITFSLLSRWLSCKERFRLLVVEGLKIGEGFNHRLEYGNMWHVCEEGLAEKGCVQIGKVVAGGSSWRSMLDDYMRGLMSQYPMDKEQILKWYNVCKVQFPIYVDYWSKHPDMANRTPLLSEQVFNVPYQLPSGRTVYLKGKWDSVDLVKKKCTNCNGTGKVPILETEEDDLKEFTCNHCKGGKKVSGIWLMENKTKGDIKEQQLQRQLTFDLQTMLYVIALERYDWRKQFDIMKDSSPLSIWSKAQFKGIRYNVIRRPLSGGKGTIVQHKATKSKQAESSVDYYARLGKIIADDPGYYFMRWDVEITQKDIQTFKQQCLDPILENLCDWWEFTKFRDSVGIWTQEYCGIHWRHPFGVYNPLDEGVSSDLDEYLNSGSEVGLTRTDNLFPELQS